MLESTDTDARWIWSRKPPSRQVESALYTSRVSSRAFLNIISSSNLFTVLILSYLNFYISAVSSAGGTATSSTTGASATVSAGAAGSSTGGSLAPGSGSVDSAGADGSMSASGSGVGSDGSGAGSGSSSGASVSGAGSGAGSGCGVGALALPPLPAAAAACPPFRASCMSARTSSLLRHWSSTQISSCALNVFANTSPIPLPASANHFVILAKRFLRNLSVVDPFSIVSSSASASARSATLVTPMLAYARFTWTSTFPCWYSLSFIVTLSPPSKSPSATPIVMLEDVAFIPTPVIEDNMMRSPALIIPFSVVTFTGTRPANAIRSGCLAYFCTSSPKV